VSVKAYSNNIFISDIRSDGGWLDIFQQPRKM
jgi:hypothetical protein